MTEYEFTLRFDVSAVEMSLDDSIELLGAAGCDDALVGSGTSGRIALDFIRAADSAEDAVLSAVGDVKTALPRAVLLEATPDLVGYTEIAALVGRSRQGIRQLLLGGKDAGPMPAHEGPFVLWHLGPVLEWLRDKRGYEIRDDLVELAYTNMRLNIAADQMNYGAPTATDVHGVLTSREDHREGGW